MNSLAHQEDPKARNHLADLSGGNADALGRLSAGLVERGAVNDVLSAPSFAPFIDARRIGVVGFSPGGATALGLAGLRFDGAAQDINCATGPDAADCGFFLRGGVRFGDHPGFEPDARDDRISMAVAVDPDFGVAVDATSFPASQWSIWATRIAWLRLMSARKEPILQHDCQVLPMW